MTTFDVGLYQSQRQYDENGNAVINRVATYLENGTDNTPHSINTSKKGTVSIPEECRGTSFTTQYPCDRSFDVTYDGPYYWWEDYTQCVLGNTASDSNLLISDCDGVCGGGRAEGGSVSNSTRAFTNANAVENLPSSFTDYDVSCGAFSMGIAMQEVGHNLMAGISDDDGDDQDEHDTADTIEHGGDYYTTPMGVSYWGQDELSGDNECGDNIDRPTGSRYVHFHYSTCAGSKMG